MLDKVPRLALVAALGGHGRDGKRRVSDGKRTTPTKTNISDGKRTDPTKWTTRTECTISDGVNSLGRSTNTLGRRTYLAVLVVLDPSLAVLALNAVVLAFSAVVLALSAVALTLSVAVLVSDGGHLSLAVGVLLGRNCGVLVSLT